MSYNFTFQFTATTPSEWININISLIAFTFYLYQSQYLGPMALIIDMFLYFPHLSDSVRKMNIYGLSCSFFVYHYWCDGLDEELFLNLPPLRSGEIYEPKKEEDLKKISTAPTCGQLCRSQANTPFHHRGLYSNRTWPAVGTYGTCDCFLTPITPTGDHLAASHSTNSTHLHC